MCKLNIAAGIHSATASEFPLFPQLANSRLLTTDHQYSGWLLSGMLPAPYATHGSDEHREEHTWYLECCQSDDPRTRGDKRAI